MTGENCVWFAMRVTYRREIKVRKILDEEGIENYIPMRKTVRIRRGRRVKELVPVVRGLVFVHTVQPEIQRVKDKIPYLQYIMDRRAGTKIIVPAGKPVVITETAKNVWQSTELIRSMFQTA